MPAVEPENGWFRLNAPASRRRFFESELFGHQNILERATLLSDGAYILPEHLPEEVVEAHGCVVQGPDDSEEIVPLRLIEERSSQIE